MKTSTLPPLRVSDELRRDAESVLEKGETLSALVLDAVTRNIEYRKARSEFIARGIRSGVSARATDEYVPAGEVLQKMALRLRSARRRAALKPR
ncbi:MAG: prevent-host-death protein [Gammaproteobacteria bacterium]|nr:prevent-host-death protein [Gammaproteobacteria bacterium]